MSAVQLSKHHGLGNDFLVVFTTEDDGQDWATAAKSLCDRRRGIGADGLLVATVPTPAGEAKGSTAGPADDLDGERVADVHMRLFNADGSEAEMSGNGIRCLAQAWLLRRGEPADDVLVMTGAGLRAVTFGPDDARVGLDGDPATSLTATVDMGTVDAQAPPRGWDAVGVDGARPVAHLNVGNPHTVVAVDDVREVDLAAIGALVPDVNLEIVHAGPEPDAITMRVHERGAGVTEACGTGACAAAWAAAQWGLVAPGTEEITVHMDGGDARVGLHRPAAGRVTLTGPTAFVGTVEVGI